MSIHEFNHTNFENAHKACLENDGYRVMIVMTCRDNCEIAVRKYREKYEQLEQINRLIRGGYSGLIQFKNGSTIQVVHVGNEVYGMKAHDILFDPRLSADYMDKKYRYALIDYHSTLPKLREQPLSIMNSGQQSASESDLPNCECSSLNDFINSFSINHIT